MVRLRAACSAAAAVLTLGLASAAYAAPPDLVNTQDNTAPFSALTSHKSYQFESKSGWGLKLDLDEPANRSAEWKDVTAGAYFHISPSIKLGGSVGLGDKFSQPQQQLTPQDAGPRVHLETKFQF